MTETKVAVPENQKDKKLKKEKKEKKQKKEKRPADTPAAETTEPATKKQKVDGDFDDFPIRDEIKENLKKQGIMNLFPIQVASFPHIYAGEDVLGRSRTGTGKTLAFCLPLLERYAKNITSERGRKPLVLVMTPTRELAKQIGTVVAGTAPNVSLLTVYGGTRYDEQQNKLRQGVDWIVGTPGRLIDLIERGSLGLQKLRCIVLDEADQMLDKGFGEDMEKILQLSNQQRKEDNNTEKVQMLLYSATVPAWVLQTSKKYMDPNHKMVDLVSGDKVKAGHGIQHLAVQCHWDQRNSVLGSVVMVYSGAHGRTMVFANKKKEANELALDEHIKTDCQVLHGDIPQEQRERTMAAFRAGKFKCLVATDVAARGLDVPEVDLVVNTEPPADPAMYIHRAGRTARAGKEGICVTFFTLRTRYLLSQIEQSAGIKFQLVGPPQPADIIKASAKDSVKFLDKVHKDVVSHFTAVAEQLIEERGAVPALAAALACLSGQTDALAKRSLMTGSVGLATLQISLTRSVNAPSFFWSLIRRFSPDFEEHIKNMRMTLDQTGAVFDVPVDKVAAFLEGWSSARDITISEAEKLPELVPLREDNNSFGGRGGGRGGSSWGGRGGNFSSGRGGSFSGGRSTFSAGRGRGRW